LCEHNHFERKKSGVSGTIYSIMHLRNGCSSYGSFSKETQSHQKKTLAKRSAKYADFIIYQKTQHPSNSSSEECKKKVFKSTKRKKTKPIETST
jgi:hypothetical protein